MTPPLSPNHRDELRFFSIEEVPLLWKEGDLLTELYEVRERLGEGSMGVVYRVFHRGWGVDMAVKSPRAELSGSEVLAAAFEHECNTWIRLSPHRNSVRCYYVRRLGEIPRIFTEFVDGSNLLSLIHDARLYRNGKAEAIERILDIAIQMAYGLQHAHQEGVLHRDVKPSNILVSDEGIVKLTDFGLSKLSRHELFEAAVSSTGTVQISRAGTPAFRCPDHSIQNKFDSTEDIWGWGLCVTAMFAGEVFWRDGKNARAILETVVNEPLHPDEVPCMPRELVDLLGSCFEEEPEARLSDISRIAQKLEFMYQEVTGQEYQRVTSPLTAASFDALNNRAVSLLDLGKHSEAERLWDELLEGKPDHLQAVYNLLLHRWRTGKISDEEISHELHLLRDSFPNEWLPSYWLARVLIERGYSREALSLLDREPKSNNAPREIAFATVMAENRVRHDRHLIWETAAPTQELTAVALSPRGEHAATGSIDGQIHIWDLRSHQRIGTLEGHEGGITSLSFGKDGTTLLSSSADHTLRTWDYRTAECSLILQGHVSRVRTAALNKACTLALSGGSEEGLRLWDIRSGGCLRVFDGHTLAINSAAFSACGNFAISGSGDRTAKFWNLRTGQCLKTLGGNSSPITSVLLSPSRFVAVTSSGKKIKIWNLENGTLVRRIRAHEKKVCSLCMTKNGRYVVSAAQDGTFKIWDIYSGQCLTSFKGYAPISLSADSRFGISVSQGSRFGVWSLHINKDTLPAPFAICRHQ